LWDRFMKSGRTGNGSRVVPVNGASTNTAPSLIKNYSDVGDDFDLQVEAMTKSMGY
jgi:hypothetical protein